MSYKVFYRALQGFLQSFTRFSTELYKVFYRGTRFSMKDRYSGVTNQITAFVTTRIYIVLEPCFIVILLQCYQN